MAGSGTGAGVTSGVVGCSLSIRREHRRQVRHPASTVRQHTCFWKAKNTSTPCRRFPSAAGSRMFAKAHNTMGSCCKRAAAVPVPRRLPALPRKSKAQTTASWPARCVAMPPWSTHPSTQRRQPTPCTIPTSQIGTLTSVLGLSFSRRFFRLNKTCRFISS